MSAERQALMPASGFVQRGFETLERTTYSLATTSSEKEELYRLRYRAYLNEEWIDPNDSGRLNDAFDDQPNSYLFGLRYDHALVGSIRIQIDSPARRGTASTVNFADVLKPYLGEGKSLIDPNRLVVEPDVQGKLPHMPYMAVRLVVLAAVHFGADYGISTPRPEHFAFYRRLLNARPICPLRPFPGLKKPVGVLIAEVPAAINCMKLRYPFMVPRPGESEAIFGERSQH